MVQGLERAPGAQMLRTRAAPADGCQVVVSRLPKEFTMY